MKILQQLSFVLLLTLTAGLLSAQEGRYFIPLEIQKAYENGTRSYDGKPGPKYWQNTADYTMEVSIDPKARKIDGTEEVVYHNNSPNELRTLVVRLYYDAFRKGNARAEAVRPDDITDGTEIKRLAVNGQEYDLSKTARRSGTNLFITLKTPLKSGEKLTMNASWSQLLPWTNERTGTYDSTAFFVAYWYPQIAVYDDIFGWDQLSYNLRTEFYNELGNFDVRITAPESFTVWATGTLQNAEEVLPQQQHERYQSAKTATETVHVLTADDLSKNFRHRSGTWHYTAQEVSDFAFALSDHYLWDATSLKVEGRDVLISTAFPLNRAPQFAGVTTLQQKTMKHFSEDFPGIPYPYPAFTTFIGLRGGGMEYPMMANNDGPSAGVTIHEMFHTYFPMYVRINEKRFAWMDEGWADFNTSVVMTRFMQKSDRPLFSGYKAQMQGTVGSISDLPLITSSQFMDNTNYGYASYPLPAFFYSLLHHHLGDELFLKAYREYIRRWAKKSPTPYDFFHTFENVSGQDLSWLIKPWFFEQGYPDLAIGSFKKGVLTVEKRGARPVPVKVMVKYSGGESKDIIAGSEVWKNGKSSYELKIPDYKNAEFVSVNLDVPDATDLNNFFPSLDKLYTQFPIEEQTLGAYMLKEFPVQALISRRDGAMFLQIPDAGMQAYLMPQNATEFQSLDGMLKVQFKKEESGIIIKVQGMTVTGTKQ